MQIFWSLTAASPRENEHDREQRSDPIFILEEHVRID
jgi:hypothetical protein